MNIQKTFFLTFFLTITFVNAAPLPEVNFIFSGIKKVTGKIYLIVVQKEEAFKADTPAEKDIVYKAAVMVENENLRLSVAGLKPGQYGAKFFQDLNENGKLDLNSLKVPKEPYGFSNNVKGLFGPPKFKKVLFTVGDKDINFKMKFF